VEELKLAKNNFRISVRHPKCLSPGRWAGIYLPMQSSPNG